MSNTLDFPLRISKGSSLRKSHPKTPKTIDIFKGLDVPDPSSNLDVLAYFNLTNEGRLWPEKRTTFADGKSQSINDPQKDTDQQKSINDPNRAKQLDHNPQKEQKMQDEKLTTEKPEKNLGEIRTNSKKFDEQLDALDLISKTNLNPKPQISEQKKKAHHSETNSPTNELALDKFTLKIPELPSGQVLQIHIFSTWGDKHYVGLAGIELFDAFGKSIIIHHPKEQIDANPRDINVLPQYGKDPRTIDKLMDGTYLTCDDMHEWLAPFSFGNLNVITIKLLQKTTLSMIRI